MNELIIKRIEELWPFYTTVRLDPKSSRFRDVEINGIHISKLNLSQLDDKTLLDVYEMVIRRCSKQM